MNVNKLILFLLVFALAACSGTTGNQNRKVKEVPAYKIGVNMPFTGSASYFAEEFRKGMDLVFEHYNDSSGKMHLEIVYEDNKLSPRDAITITKKLIEVDEVDLVIVGYTPIIQATASLLEQAEMPSLFTLCSAEAIAAPYHWAFRDFEVESENMKLMAEFVAEDLARKKGSWLVVNDDMGMDAAKFFTAAFENHGGTILTGEVFEPSEMDLRNKISKVMDGGPEFILLVGRGPAMINACRQIREQDRELPVIGSNSLNNPQVWNALGDNSEQIYYPSPYVDTKSKLYRKANDRFIRSYGNEMNWLNIYGLTTASYLVKAFRETGGDKDKLRGYLAGLDEPSLRGQLRMDENGDVSVENTVHTWKDGRSVMVNRISEKTTEQQLN